MDEEKVNIKVRITLNEEDASGMHNVEYLILEPTLISGMKGFLIARNATFIVGGIYSGSLQFRPKDGQASQIPLIQELDENLEYVPHFGKRIYSFFDAQRIQIAHIYERSGRRMLGKSYNTDEYIENHLKQAHAAI